MGKLNKVLAGAVCTLALLGAGCAGGAKVDQSSPEAVVSTFLTAIQKQDKTSAKAVAAPGSDIAENFDDGWADVSRLPLKSFKVLSVEENDVRVELTISEGGETETDTETIQVVQKDGKWWIVDL